MSRPPELVNEGDLPWSEVRHGQHYVIKRKALGVATGGARLGCSLVELEPGRHSWPFHFHLGNEEAMYILDGKGTLRLGKEDLPIRSGDYISFKVGPAGAHQVINTTTQPLRYLCFSTMVEPDIVVYPDSNKVGLFAGAAPGGPKESRTMQVFLERDATLQYWDRE